MTTLTNSFEGLTSGTTLTAGSGGNTGGTSGNYLDTITIGASCTLAADSTRAAHGTESLKVATPATGAVTKAQWDASLGSSVTQAWFRQYLYFTANPATAVRIFEATTSGAALCACISLTSTGIMQFRDSTNAVNLIVMANAIPLNAWFRIEGYVIGAASGGAGQVQLSLYDTMDSGTATESQTSATGASTAGPMGQWQFGVCGATANITYWQDDLGLSNTGYVGPVSSGTNATAGLAAASASQALGQDDSTLASSVSLGMTIQGH